ncbi:hypothetical protein CVT25_001866 [Psilocybe cyanescens]|uniref:Uncharacterized protein n=1 Tax=Psilocybe cyanescens TaxID=93625 RepID=A0A409WQE4_PSICY|nr:hypothetical protein CVT25_001866 [Psilocybe cyanescens]
MASLDDFMSSSGPDTTIYYDSVDSSHVATHTADTTRVEEHEVEDLLALVSSPTEKSDDASSMKMNSRPSLHITQVTPPATPVAVRPYASSPLPVFVEVEDTSSTTLGRSSPLVSQSPSPSAPSTPVATKSRLTSLPPLLSLFPGIEPHDIMSVLAHELRATDLYRLGTRHTHNRAHKDYNTFDSLYFPLLNYFSILSIHFANDYMVPLVFFDFLSHLQDISSEYEWPAVRQYTIEFFNRRRVEMFENSDYSRWSFCDTDLAEEHLSASKKVLIEECGAISSSTTAVITDDVHRHIPPTTMAVESSQVVPLLIGSIW